MYLVCFLYMIIASTFTIGKLVLQYVQPIFFIGVRMVLGGSLLLGYHYFFGRTRIVLKKKHIFDFLFIIVFHIFVAFVAEFLALQYLNSSKVCLFYNLSPFITAVFSYFWFSERMTTKKFFGLIFGVLGFLPIIIVGANGSSAIGVVSWPELLMFVSVMSSSYGWIVVRNLGRQGYSIILINGIGMLGGGILALITSFFFEGYPALKVVSSSASTDFFVFIGYTVLLILLANVFFYNLYGFLLHRYTATFLSFAGFLTPIFASFYGFIFLQETVGWSFFLTIFFVFVGLYIFYQEEIRQGYIVKK